MKSEIRYVLLQKGEGITIKKMRYCQYDTLCDHAPEVIVVCCKTIQEAVKQAHHWVESKERQIWLTRHHINGCEVRLKNLAKVKRKCVGARRK